MARNETYEEFVAKFEPKRTTDDCLTPPPVFDAILQWAAKEYHFDPENIVRPFWPGGDYEHFEYPDGCVVCDNPPFSIESKIVDFYTSRGIRFFLFAPSLTLCSCIRGRDVTAIVINVNFAYENGAKVKTGFLTNLDTRYRIRTAPSLANTLTDVIKKLERERVKELPKYSFPDCVVSSAHLQRIANYVDFGVPKAEAMFIGALESMRNEKKAIYGGGFLISERAAAERAAAERAAAERAAAERDNGFYWALSEEELEAQRGLQLSE